MVQLQMLEDIIPIVVVSAIITGAIGLFLGSSINRGFAGFFLGFFLGPIGLIIVFLLPKKISNSPRIPTMGDINELTERTRAAQERPSSQTQTQTPKERPPRDLTSDAYKIWLGGKYEIKHNELFEKFECDGKLFESVDDALKYADELEAEEERIREEKEAEEERIREEKEAEEERIREGKEAEEERIQEEKEFGKAHKASIIWIVIPAILVVLLLALST